MRYSPRPVAPFRRLRTGVDGVQRLLKPRPDCDGLTLFPELHAGCKLSRDTWRRRRAKVSTPPHATPDRESFFVPWHAKARDRWRETHRARRARAWPRIARSIFLCRGFHGAASGTSRSRGLPQSGACRCKPSRARARMVSARAVVSPISPSGARARTSGAGKI